MNYPFKVVCVDDKDFSANYHIKPNGYPVLGQVYTATNCVRGRFNGVEVLGYQLAELPIVWANEHAKAISTAMGFDLGWHIRRFVPLDYYRDEFCITEMQEAAK